MNWPPADSPNRPPVTPTFNPPALRAPTGAEVLWGLAAALLGGGVLWAPVIGAVVLLRSLDLLTFSVLPATAGGLVGMVVMLRRRFGWSWRDLGFVRPRMALTHLIWQIPLALLVAGSAAGLVITLLGLTPADEGDRQSTIGGLHAPAWVVITAALGAVVFAPAGEELFFRRLLLGWLCTRMPVTAAVLTSAVCFAVVHVLPAAMAYVVWLGLAMALLTVRNQSILPSFVLHASNNAVAVAIAIAGLHSAGT